MPVFADTYNYDGKYVKESPLLVDQVYDSEVYVENTNQPYTGNYYSTNQPVVYANELRRSYTSDKSGKGLKKSTSAKLKNEVVVNDGYHPTEFYRF